MYQRIGATIYTMMKPFMGIIFSGRLRTRALIIHGSQVLLLRNWIGKQDWSMPGGGAKNGEQPAEALVREINEELGLDVRPESLEFLLNHEHEEGKAKYPMTVYSLTSDQKPQFTVRRPEIIEAKWFDIDELPEPLNDLINNAISAYRSKQKG